MNLRREYMAGVLGGIAMSAVMYFARLLGLNIRLELLIGTMLGLPPSPAAWAVGFCAHVVLAGFIGLLYGVAFEYVAQHRADWELGVAFSFVHLTVAGILVGVLPSIDPLFPGWFEPGPFLVNQGSSGMALFILAHLVYGAVVGSLDREAVGISFTVYNFDDSDEAAARRRGAA